MKLKAMYTCVTSNKETGEFLYSINELSPILEIEIQ